MDKIERLKIFCMVADQHSFAEVARNLSLPRSTVTHAIQHLEKEYEVLLFYRTTRRVNLTHEGGLFYQEASQLLQLVKELNRFKHQIRSTQGKITVGLPKRLATQILIPRLKDFYTRYPEITVHVKCCDAYSNLVEQQLDCVLRVGPVKDEYLIAKFLGYTHLSTLVAPDYLQKYGKPKQLNHTEHHIAVDYLVEKNLHKNTKLVFKHEQISLSYHIVVEDTESYIQAGLAGLGIIQIPEFDARSYIAEGQLIEVFEHLAPIELPLHLLRTDRKFRPQYLHDFMLWLEQLMIEHLALQAQSFKMAEFSF